MAVPSGEPSQAVVPDDQVDRLLTVDEVAAWFRVPPSWVYSRTRARGKERLSCIKVGKYVRFDPSELRAFLARLRLKP
jgi:hypothetical protein